VKRRTVKEGKETCLKKLKAKLKERKLERINLRKR
jgi:hypothetical protein